MAQYYVNKVSFLNELPFRTFMEVKGQEVPVRTRIKFKFSKMH